MKMSGLSQVVLSGPSHGSGHELGPPDHEPQRVGSGRVDAARPRATHDPSRRRRAARPQCPPGRAPVPGVQGRKRGCPSSRRLPEVLHAEAVGLVREKYGDFGPTLACEKLAETHGIDVSVETLRQWMIGDGVWLPRNRRLPRAHQPRSRRPCLGELVQIDGCNHEWFEDRGPRCVLLVYVDDATSRLMKLLFVRSESAFDYFAATRSYLEEHGRPLAFYSDKHSVFRVTAKEPHGGDGGTQFSRAMSELNVDILCANSP